MFDARREDFEFEHRQEMEDSAREQHGLDGEYKCSNCGDKCSVVPVDFGIGPYEYCGQNCNHKDVQLASECCEADYEDWDEEEE